MIRILLILSSIFASNTAQAQGLPALELTQTDSGGQTYSLSLQILLLMTANTVLPSIVLGMSAFTRIIIVLSILRQAMGTQQTPPNQVLIAIALFLSAFVMQPQLTTIYEQAASPYLDDQISQQQAWDITKTTMSDFMLDNTRQNDLLMFAEL